MAVASLYHSGTEVYQSEEFQAFCKKFGIAWELSTTRMVITIDFDEMLQVEQRYLPGDRKETADTTNCHNKVWRTRQPIPRIDRESERAD